MSDDVTWLYHYGMTDKKIENRLNKIRKTLTTNEIEFVNLYLGGSTPANAYEQSELGVADKKAATMLIKSPKVQMYIDLMERSVASRGTLELEAIDQKLTDLAMANVIDMVELGTPYVDRNGNEKTPVNMKDPAELTAAQRSAITSIKTTDGGVEIRVADKIKALELLAKRRGGFTEQVDVKLGANVEIFANVGNNHRGPDNKSDR